MIYEYQPSCQVPVETLDRIYSDTFGGLKHNGCLVEFGAHNGWSWSCTWGLSKIGWRALYIEPVVELYRQCVSTYLEKHNVEVVNCSIGDVNAMVNIGMCEYGASLLSHDGIFSSQQWRLDDLLLLKHIPTGFDLLVVDVEGGEEKVLAGFTLSRWLPRLVIIERPPVPNCFTNGDYDEVYKDEINTIYRSRH